MSSTDTLPLLVVIGATGNQGGSVVSRFLSLSPSTYRIRGLTRNPSSAASQALVSKGVEMVAADLDDPASLDRAFEGASAIFATTDFWAPYHNPANKDKGKEKGILRNEWVYRYELQQGKNILGAAAKVPTLDRLVYSALADTTGLSNEKYMYVYHFASKAHAINFARTEYPELMAKTSIIQVAGYLSNFLSFPGMKPEKNQETGAYIFSSPFPEGFRMPFVAAEEDTGPFTEALLKAPAGKNLLACRAEMTMDDIAALWGETLGKKVELRAATKMGMPEGLDEETMAFMREFAETGMWAVEFGYAGEKVDKTVTKPDQLDVEVKLPSVKEWIAKQDWSGVL